MLICNKNTHIYGFVLHIHDFITTTKMQDFLKYIHKKCLEKHQQEPLSPYKASF